MNSIRLILLIGFMFIIGCRPTNTEELVNYFEKAPNQTPIPFKPELIPQDKIIHRGIFSPDHQRFYYVISTPDYRKFDVKAIQKQGVSWSLPQDAFFNSTFDDHGISFSPDGATLYFSSTRPTGIDTLPETWHLWQIKQRRSKWGEPSFIDIPNLRDKLLSHPSVTKSGNLYFHASNLDYSNMKIYCTSTDTLGMYQAAQLVEIPMDGDKCTPYISPDEKYLIFAKIGQQLDLYLTFKTAEGWSEPIILPATINQQGQGNPWVSLDGNYLFYARAEEAGKWFVNWVNVEEFLAKHVQ